MCLLVYSPDFIGCIDNVTISNLSVSDGLGLPSSSLNVDTCIQAGQYLHFLSLSTEYMQQFVYHSVQAQNVIFESKSRMQINWVLK